MQTQIVFGAIIVVIYGVLAWTLVQCIYAGRPVAAALLSVLMTPGIMLFVGVVVEGRPFLSMINPATQSWAALFGDTFVLSTAAAVLALAWGRVQPHPFMYYIRPFFSSKTYAFICILFAVLVAVYFHSGEILGYSHAGAGQALWSPTKVIHDWCVYPAMVGVLVGMAVPLMWRNPRRWTWHVYALLACLLVWALLVVIDSNRGLQPINMHPLWDPARFTPLSRS